MARRGLRREHRRHARTIHGRHVIKISKTGACRWSRTICSLHCRRPTVSAGRRTWRRWNCVRGRCCTSRAAPPAFVYFPTTAVVSLMSMTHDGASAELAVVGKDGMVGVAVFMGGSTMFSQAVVQCAGQAYRLRARPCAGNCSPVAPCWRCCCVHPGSDGPRGADGAVQPLPLDRPAVVPAAAAGPGPIAVGRVGDDAGSVANLLGVRREGVTAAALKLQHAGVIRYQRGHIVVLDRDRLEQRACECYACAKKEHQRCCLLPTTSRWQPAAAAAGPCQPARLARGLPGGLRLPALCALADGEARRIAHTARIGAANRKRLDRGRCGAASRCAAPKVPLASAQNHLIELLPRATAQRLLALCEPVQLVLSQVLVRTAARRRAHVYFPTRASSRWWP